MRPRDDFYTPTNLADKLASYIIEDEILSVVDFCVGDGDLLKAVEKRFPYLEFFGADITQEVIESLRKVHPLWQLDVCDFTDSEAFDKLPILGKRKYDLIVLNPPFTCKGSSIRKIVFEGEIYHVSTAMQFVANAMKYRSLGGVVYAILPNSCAHSQKDRALWHYLENHHNLQILEEPQSLYWKDCSANIILVSIGEKAKRVQNKKKILFDFSTLPIESIVRGHISPRNANIIDGKKGIQYVHTTNLQSHNIVNCRYVELPPNRDVVRYGSVSCNGPAVLLPRVCNPNSGKICVYKKKCAFVPSDCIIVLRTSKVEDAQLIADTILKHWGEFRSIYQGTAAKYTTMDKLRFLFGKELNK